MPDKLVEALDVTTQLAMAAGLDALREAGIPLVQKYRKTTTGRYLPDRWQLPEALRDETGVVFASAFPGYDRFADETRRCYTYEARRAQRALLEDLRLYTSDEATLREIQRRTLELDDLLEREPYAFDRRFFGPSEVRAQITGSDDGGGIGWMLWNPRNTYTEAALRIDATAASPETR